MSHRTLQIAAGLLLAASVLAPGCSCRDDDGEAAPRNIFASAAAEPRLPVPLAADSEATVIDAHRLEAAKPDAVQAGRRAWKLGSLVSALPNGAVLEVERAGGQRLLMALPHDRDGAQPAIARDMHGNLYVTLIADADKVPLPPLRRAGRGGKPMQSAGGVLSFRVLAPDGSLPQASPAGGVSGGAAASPPR